ncbi:CPBP family intramembrane glutamic endopeptidase [Nocardia nova]|uniref:CPBP family intramembrane glutamic endopeptidase n=1 Tax=Nocardia nova TaxID=37330 RepID=UPI0033EAA90E
MVTRRSDIAVYIVVAYVLAWVFGSIPWIDGKGLHSLPWLQDGAALMMAAPTLAVLVVRRWRGRPVPARPAAPGVAPDAGFAADVGLGLGSSPARTARLIVAAWFGVQMVAWIAYEISAALGWYHFDLTSAGADLIAGMIVEALTVMIVATVPQALGEEIGWRGWLLPRLIAWRGTPAAFVVTGIVWALWHAPLTLLGYGYTDIGAWSALAYIPFCICFGAFLGWLRMRSGSVWPSAVGHASWNAVIIVFGALTSRAPGDRPHSLLTGSGVTGWALWALLAAALFTLAPVARPSVPAARISVQT